MNREELTQTIEGACLNWERDTQAALSRALGGVTYGSASTTVERWEAIRFAIEQQSRELRELRERGTTTAETFRQEGREEVLEQLETERKLHRASLDRLRSALGMPGGGGWEATLKRVERWRDRYAELARLWLGLSDDALVPSMGNLIRSLQVRNTAHERRQRAEDAAELREILGASSQGMNWAGILCRVRDLASLAQAIEAVAHPRITMNVVSATAAGPIERGDAVRIVERSPLVDKATP